MSSANFKLKRTAAASRGFLATAGFSCYDKLQIDISMRFLVISSWLSIGITVVNKKKKNISHRRGGPFVCELISFDAL